MKVHYILIIALLAACSSSDSLEEKKSQLEKLKSEVSTLNQEIQSLEAEIQEEDPTFGDLASLYSLVSTMTIDPEPFEHRFEVRAQVASRKNVQISAEAMGRVQQIRVREGDKVSKGQSLLSLDADVLLNSIAELKTSLDLATTVFEKRERLWKQNIGSEIQYLEAKNNKESLERRLATSQSQLRQYQVVAPFSGVVDEVQAKQGEMAQPGLPLLRMVSVNEMHLVADVSETYLGTIKVGDSVGIYFPTFDQELSSTVASIGQVINEQNRTYAIEVKLPKSGIAYKPNLVGLLRVRDYYKEQSLVIPSSLIQQDNQGDFIYLLQEEGDQKQAKKVHIKIGKSYDTKTEVVSGVQAGDLVINEGHREVTDGSLVQIAERETL